MENAVFGYDEAERRTGIKRATLYAMVHQNRIPHIRIGRRFVRFRASDLEEWLRTLSVPVQSASE